MNTSIAFDRAVEYYDQTRGFPAGTEGAIAALIAQTGNLNTDSRVLEIGVGTGRIALPLSAHVNSYYGVDLSRPMMNKLRGKQKGESIFLTEADATRLPFASNRFDAAVVVHVFHLIPNWRDALSELGRVLKPNAPVIHCWTQDNDLFRDLWDVWNTVIPNGEPTPVGAQWRKNPTFLEDEGWQPAAEPLTYVYSVPRKPSEFLAHVKGRIWSALWRVNDDDLARGAAAMEAAIHEKYPNPDEPVQNQSTFYARAYVRVSH
jgi:ubiquinone/menaquinone biosynthesis C-methylase UbiE